MGTDNARSPEARIPQWIASGFVSLIVAAALGSFALVRDLDRTVMALGTRLDTIEDRQLDLRAQLRCNPTTDTHQVCTRLARLERALEKYHKEEMQWPSTPSPRH